MLLRPLRQLAANTACKSLLRQPSLLCPCRLQSSLLTMADTVDLTFSSDEEQEDQEQAQRKRIMAFAQQQNKRNKIANAHAPASVPPEPASKDAFEADKDEAGPSTSSPNNLLAQLHEERRRRQQQASGATAGPSNSNEGAGAKAGPSSGRPTSIQPRWSPSRSQDQTPAASARQEVSILSYNVWFRKDVALQARMDAIGRIIEDSGYPNFLCFQEVTPLILSLWRSAPWWCHYAAPAAPFDRTYHTLLLAHKEKAPVPAMAFRDKEFPNSVMGRSLMTVDVPFGGGAQRLVVATSHLESPIPQQQNFYSDTRKKQLASAISALDDTNAPNVLFVGDMNWIDSRDGTPALTPGWQDVWQQLRPREEGLTYDTKGNVMLFGSWAGSRLDRCFAKLTGYRAASIQMVGTEALPGVTYEHTARNGYKRKMPVLPSDHYGLLIKLQPL